MTLRTARLDLVAATSALARADLAGREALAAALGAEVPEAWPPELFDEAAIEYALGALESDAAQAGWWTFYLVLRAPVPVLVGVAGYKGPPDASGEVEIGYSVVGAFQRRGLASEASAALVARAFAQPDVRRVVAETLPALVPSIGVMEKVGMTFVGEGSEPGVIRYAIDRAAFEAGGGRTR